MKNTTQKIYDIITNENFENIAHKLDEKVTSNRWTIPERNEFTYEELLNDLPDIIDILKQNIEDGNFDTLPYNTRNSIYQSMNAINDSISNIYNNSQQFATVQDHTQSLMGQIRINRLDFEARNIPRYKEKISEYRELISILTNAKSIIEDVANNEEYISELKDESEKAVEKINKLLNEASEERSAIAQHLDISKETLNQINALLETIKENKENTIRILEEANNSNRSIEDIKNDIIKYHQHIEETEKKLDEIISKAKQDILEYTQKTDEIIQRNEEQTNEIDRQLEKAVGVSLFSTFEERKKQLSKTSNLWLLLIILSVGVTVWLSMNIITDFLNNVHQYTQLTKIGWSADTNTSMLVKPIAKLNIDWMWVLLKLTMLLPLVYLISFATSRYSKERRLVEEYAFKSTISLALKPYSDLVQKIENDGTDSKYRDFLIDSIKSIFVVPTDKAFGTNNKESKDITLKNFDEAIKIVDKIKNISKE